MIQSPRIKTDDRAPALLAKAVAAPDDLTDALAQTIASGDGPRRAAGASSRPKDRMFLRGAAGHSTRPSGKFLGTAIAACVVVMAAAVITFLT